MKGLWPSGSLQNPCFLENLSIIYLLADFDRFIFKLNGIPKIKCLKQENKQKHI
jgi:hypothetical protein